MPEPFRTRPFPGFTLRWAGFQCDDLERCVVPVHQIGFVGFDFGGMDRWIPVTETIDVGVEDAERDVDRLYAEDPSLAAGWQLLTAAFGLPWSALDLTQVRRCSSACWNLPPAAASELEAQGVEGLLALRLLTGRDMAVMHPLLVELNRYRNNVGGLRREWGE